MKTPVIIPAFNEERNIATTLNALPQEVEPIVASNGSTDNTVTIAEHFGVKVFNLSEQGKLPAIQHVLRDLGERALEPLLLLDADTIPRHPIEWHRRMLSALEPQASRPIVASGPVWLTLESGETTLSSNIRSLWRIGATIATKQRAFNSGSNGAQYGPNMGIHIGRKVILDKVLGLQHYWPLEDVALTEAVVGNEGGVFKQLLDLDLLAYTPEPADYQPLLAFFREGIRKSNERTRENYIKRGAVGSKPYEP